MNDDPTISEKLDEIESRLAQCAYYIDDLYHQYDGCLEQIVDVRESKRYYERKTAEMDRQLKHKLAKLEQAILGPKAPKDSSAPRDNRFMEGQIQADLDNIRGNDQRQQN